MFVTLGLDIGYSAMKLVVSKGETITQYHLPAGVGRAHQLSDQTLTGGKGTGGKGTGAKGTEPPAIHVYLDEQEWVAGVETSRLVDYVRALHDDYSATPEYRALAYAALLSTDTDQVDLLVTGLPVTFFKRQAYRDRLVSLFRGQHQITEAQSVNVKQVQVLPQPVGGFMTLVASDPSLGQGRVLVLDPGYFSMDWLMVMDGHIQWPFCGTSHRATSTILEAAAGHIARAYGRAPTPDQLETALRLGQPSIKIFRKDVPFHHYVEKAAEDILHSLQHEIMAPLRRMSGGTTAIDAVILVGGAATIYQGVVKKVFSHADLLVPPNPVMANAQGFHEFASLAERTDTT